MRLVKIVIKRILDKQQDRIILTSRNIYTFENNPRIDSTEINLKCVI